MTVPLGILGAALTALLVATSARAGTGVGELPRRPDDIQVAPMQQLGDNAFRFSAYQWRRSNWVLELRQDDARKASGRITFYGSDQKEIGWLTLYLRSDEYDQLMAKIDGALAEGDKTPLPATHGEVWVCTDRDGFISERRTAGRTTWTTTGDCGNVDPNEEVRDLLLEAFQWRISCAYRPVLGSCSAQH